MTDSRRTFLQQAATAAAAPMFAAQVASAVDIKSAAGVEAPLGQ